MGGMGWRTEDGGRRGFAAGGEVVLAPTEYEWGIGRVGGTMFRSGTRLLSAFLNRNGTRLFEIWGKYKLCPPLKFRTYCGSGVGW